MKNTETGAGWDAERKGNNVYNSLDEASGLPQSHHLDRAMKKVQARIETLQDRRKRRLAGKKTMPL